MQYRPFLAAVQPELRGDSPRTTRRARHVRAGAAARRRAYPAPAADTDRARWSALLLCLSALVAVGCGRSELDVPEDIVGLDATRPDVPDGTASDVTCRDNRDCDDMNFCDGTELCVDGRCRAGVPVVCEDGVACTVDRCNEGTRMCSHVPDDGRCPGTAPPSRCDAVRGCTTESCMSSAECDDRDPCNGREDCVSGMCVRGPALACDDGVACTVDRCEPGIGCSSQPDDRLCDDGIFCNGPEACSQAVGGCTRSTGVRCDDGDPCTSDACDEAARRCSALPTDADRDGFPPVQCGGRDCDDGDPQVGPTATEVCNDRRDNNCDGRTDCADPACGASPLCAPCVPTGAENGPAACRDGRDNDCNGFTDCGDATCRAIPDFCAPCMPTGAENGPGACRDGRDNDCNGFTDCGDVACVAAPECCRPTGPESGAPACADGRDNDCDGLTDCADPACVGGPGCVPTNDTCANPTPIAVPGRASGTTVGSRDDFAPSCRPGGGAPDVVYTFTTRTRQTIVVDTIGSVYDTVVAVRRNCVAGPDLACDDDGAGFPASRVELTNAEPGTYFVVVDGFGGASGAYQLNVSVVAPPEVCDNLRDDDGDGLTDCRDPDCAAAPACACLPTGPESNPLACGDGRDNDCDRAVDCADSDCVGVPPCACVVSPEVCTDARDNDCDRLTDCADPDCRAAPSCMICVPEVTDATCSDGRDNDCDGRVDCGDPSCATTGPCNMCVPTGAEFSDAACSDGRDNDCDRAVDCADPGCRMAAACRVPPPNDTCASPIRVAVPSTTVGTTFDARNDARPIAGMPAGCQGGEGPDVVYTFTVAQPTPLTINLVASGGWDTVLYVRRSDCLAGAQAACNDDFNGLNSQVAFVATPGTYYVFADGFSATSQGAFTLVISLGLPREICGNGADDDADGLTDCADSDCAAAPGCACVPTGAENNPFVCSDGRDNDCDRATDCADPECGATPACCRPLPEVCNDLRDNDCDGLVDCRDPSCAATPACNVCVPTAPQERGVAACTNGRDDDCDGQADCMDSDCRPFPAANSECCNGRDDNGNSLIDEFACACTTGAECRPGGPFPSTVCYSSSLGVCGPSCTLLGGATFCSMLLPGSRCDVGSGECR